MLILIDIILKTVYTIYAYGNTHADFKKVKNLYTTNITNARNDLYNLVDMAISDNEPVNIVTKNGNAVILSEADYNALIETLYLSSNAEYKKSLLDLKNAKKSDFVDESELKW